MWTSPAKGGPGPTRHEALPEDSLPSLLSASGTAGLTFSSTFDVHGNPAKAACHLLRTFVKVVKQPWQQTHRQQQQQKGACDAPWICFINRSFIWITHQMNWLRSLLAEGWWERFESRSPHRWLLLTYGKPSKVLPGEHPWVLAGYLPPSRAFNPLPGVALGLCEEDAPSLLSLSTRSWGLAMGQLPRRAVQLADSTGSKEGGCTGQAHACAASLLSPSPSLAQPQPCQPQMGLYDWLRDSQSMSGVRFLRLFSRANEWKIRNA